MTRRRWVIVAFLATLVVTIFFIGFVAFSHPSVTKENYRTLKAGMTRDDVRAVFGGRPYRTESGGVQDRWIGYEGCAILTYDDDGKLVWREWENVPYRKRFPDRIFGEIQWPID